MRPSMRYARSGALLLAVSVAALWPFLDAPGRFGVLLAAVVALPVQVAAFAALVRFRAQTNHFLAAWLGGVVARVGVLGVAAVAVIRSGMDGAVPLLLGLAGFFFALLMLEPLHFRAPAREAS